MCTQDPLEEIRAVFAILCSGSDNAEDDRTKNECGARTVITLGRLRTSCRLFDVRLSEAELELIFAAAAGPSGGGVDFEAFARIMRRTAWF